MTEPLNDVLRQAHEQGEYQPLIDLIPYARIIGVRCERLGDEMIFRLPFNGDNIGNPTIPALHGGVIASFLELTAVFQLMLQQQAPTLPKIIDFSVDYMRAGLAKDTYAMCEVARQGRRVANCSVTAWQGRKREPIATARAHFLLGNG
ncbi:PaaI family thioesterase [Marinobacterium arenosum]|uniref:PaaI family thioesterase n=1 Tax=Marinobacterium arenosum TaxID=2862496 RepID=UPI001C97C1D4|nr:PaaI family thioesterase [Marinobacterium arenosum]MBY4677784.1 PaaI family thioesterase [Marinobacterium arenosum]